MIHDGTQGRAIRTFGHRVLLEREKSCLNCNNFDSCQHIPVSDFLPDGFELKSNWDGRDLDPYLFSVIGGICENFIPGNQEIREVFLRAKQEKLIKQGKNEWDL